MPYKERQICSGKLLEIERYFCSRDGRRIPRGPNMTETPEDVEKVNERNSRKQLTRLINANFSAEGGDMMLTLTHGKAITEGEAVKEERNVLLRLKRAREKIGLPPLKWIAVTEKQGRWHHHIIINGGLPLEVIREIWRDRGYLSVSPLQQTYTYEELAKYLTQQHKSPKGKPDEPNIKPERQKGRRRWHASRNLVQPVVTEKIIKRPPSPGQPKPPKGYRLLPDWFVGCDLFGNLYTYCSCVRDGGAAASAPTARALGTKGVRGHSPGGAGDRAPKTKRKE